MTPVRLTKTAKADIEQAAAWYERKREELGIEFTDCVLETIDRIAANPQGYQKVISEARKAGVRKFPYVLWFKWNGDSSLVIACLHGRQSPVLAKERALGVNPLPRPKSD